MKNIKAKKGNYTSSRKDDVKFTAVYTSLSTLDYVALTRV